MMTKIHPKDSLRQLLRNVKAPDMGAQVAANWSKVLRFTHGTKLRADDLFEVEHLLLYLFCVLSSLHIIDFIFFFHNFSGV